MKSILKSYRSVSRNLEEHLAKLPKLKYKSAVEKQIARMKMEKHTLEEFMNKHGIGF